MHQANAEMQQCIQDCFDCYRVCREMAMNYCLEEGGKHVAPEHFRLMINCADICNTAVDFMLSSSSLHQRICAACADVCDACAASCEKLSGMDECVRACRKCADSCRQMAGTGKAAPRTASAHQG